MAVTLFEWVEEKNSTYGKYGMVYRCYVSDMLIGTVRSVQAELLTKRTVTAVMHKKTEGVVACDQGIEQGKTWVQTEFMEWFRATNKLAWAWLQEQRDSQPEE